MAAAMKPPFRHKARIFPSKNAFLHRTAAAFTSPRIDHESFTVPCMLALLGYAFHAVHVHRFVI